MEEEKRRSVRIKAQLVVQYRCDELPENGRKWDATTLRDISENGACITTTKCFSPQQILKLQIKIPSRPFRPLEINGRVIESVPCMSMSGVVMKDVFIVRLEFLDLNDEQKELIRTYIEWTRNK